MKYLLIPSHKLPLLNQTAFTANVPLACAYHTQTSQKVNVIIDVHVTHIMRLSAREVENDSGNIARANIKTRVGRVGKCTRVSGNKGRRVSTASAIHTLAEYKLEGIFYSHRKNIVVSNILNSPVPSQMEARKIVLVFSLPRPLANAPRTTSSMLVVRVYLASMYQICLTNAERAANRNSAPRPYLSGVAVEGIRRAPKDKYGDKRYKKVFDGERGGFEDINR